MFWINLFCIDGRQNLEQCAIDILSSQSSQIGRHELELCPTVISGEAIFIRKISCDSLSVTKNGALTSLARFTSRTDTFGATASEEERRMHQVRKTVSLKSSRGAQETNLSGGHASAPADESTSSTTSLEKTTTKVLSQAQTGEESVASASSGKKRTVVRRVPSAKNNPSQTSLNSDNTDGKSTTIKQKIAAGTATDGAMENNTQTRKLATTEQSARATNQKILNDKGRMKPQLKEETKSIESKVATTHPVKTPSKSVVLPYKRVGSATRQLHRKDR